LLARTRRRSVRIISRTFKTSNQDSKRHDRQLSSNNYTIMGRRYSLSGYLNAVLQRSSPTLLVEGPSDKDVVHRISIELKPKPTRYVIVDHTALVEDEQLRGMGAKAKVLAIFAFAEAAQDTQPKLAKQLGYLTDREWDGVPLTPNTLIMEWEPPKQEANRFTTIGHSIENYHFDCECILRYMRFAFAEQLGATALEDQIRQAYAAAVALAGAYSFEAQSHGALSRLKDLIEPEHIEYRDSVFYLTAAFDAAAQARELPAPGVFREAVNTAVGGPWRELARATHAKWLLHGHIGADALWACVARLGHVAGLGDHITMQVARGNKAERRRYWQEWLATSRPEHRAPLDTAIQWLHADSEPATVTGIAD
jgi:hypothetical protein